MLVLLFIFLRFLFGDINYVNINASTSDSHLIKGDFDWLDIGLTPGTIRRNHFQRSGFF